MTTQLQATKSQDLMVRFGKRVGLDPQTLGRTLVRTLFPSQKANNEQVYALLMVAERYGLDPILKQIYAFPAKGGGVIPIVGYDGFCKLANEHPQYDGVQTIPIMDDDGKHIGCRAILHRKDRSHPFDITEWVAECSTGSPPWKKSPARMIRNRVIAQAIRGAFSISGIHLEDEAEQIRDAEYTVADDRVDDLNAQIEARSQANDESAAEAATIEVEAILDDDYPLPAEEIGDLVERHPVTGEPIFDDSAEAV